MDTLHQRIAAALKWSLKDTQSFSLLALRDLVRPVSTELADEITRAAAKVSARNRGRQ